MPTLEALLGKKKTELEAIARRTSLKGYSALDRDSLIIALCDEPLTDEEKEIIRSSMDELKDRARKVKLRGFSKMRQAKLTLALLRQAGGETAGGDRSSVAGPSIVVKVYLGAEVVGYCPPGVRAAVGTYLRGTESVDAALEHSCRVGAATQVQALEQVMDAPPPGAKVKEPPQ